MTGIAGDFLYCPISYKISCYSVNLQLYQTESSKLIPEDFEADPGNIKWLYR